MPFTAGDKLGPYEITSLIGAGGMGEVYRARDTKLKRDVALKVLPDAFASDPARMARFQREAELLASLNHPNIATIHGVEDRALVMELVEGSSPSGPLEFDEAWKIASQIAAALDYAHERGIMHRDLKPANIMITSEGVVKLLDFGLAKAFSNQREPSASPENSPTLTLGATEVGVILGTAAYMAPEQARGKPVDKRADIWAFGVVLYELLTGERLFTGEDAAETLAAVIHKQPELEKAPAQVRKLLRRCLEKDPKKRLRDIAEARHFLEEEKTPVVSTVVTAPSRGNLRARLGWLFWGAAGLLALTTAALAFIHFRETPPVAEQTRFQIPAPEKVNFGGYLAVSPDGRRVAFSAAGPGDSIFRVWVRSLDSLEARPLPGTEAQTNALFWSPDSRWIAFGSLGKLKKVDVSGGPPQTLCDAPGLLGGSWNNEGVIIFGSANGGLSRVAEAGGAASPLTALNSSRGELSHRLPFFLPDGRQFLYRRQSGTADQAGIYIGSLDAKPDQQTSQRLLAAAGMAVYAPPPGSSAGSASSGSTGHLLFLREGALMSQPFDARRLALAGEAVPVAEQVRSGNTGNGYFSVSANGVLSYGTGGGGLSSQFTWFDREGKLLNTAGELGDYSMLSLSPDGNQVASQRSGGEGTNADIWTFEFTRGVSTRFTFDPAEERSPVWSPDGRHIAFASNRGGQFNLYQKVASGAGNEDTLLQSNQPKYPEDWSRDGRYLLYSVVDPKTKYDLWVLPLAPSNGERKPVKFLATEFNENQAQFSPDGRWIAYTSDESGGPEVYVRPFAEGAGKEAGGKWQVSKGGGSQPRWRRDGRELFYRSRAGPLMAVEVAANPTFQPGTPQSLFTLETAGGSGTNVDVRRFDVAADGKRFLVLALPGANAQAPITVVQNWQSGLKK